MASIHERRRNNIRAGIFVTLSLILVVVVTVVLSDLWRTVTTPMAEYVAVFNVASGVSNLKSGAEVRVGGLPMGRVKDVEEYIEADQPFTEIRVRFALTKRVRLYGDAAIHVATPILGNDAWLEIHSVGGAEDVMEPGGTITGRSVGGPLATLLGPELADDVADSAKLARPILENVEATSADVRAVVSDLRNEQWPKWSGNVSETLAWAADLGVSVDAAVGEGRGLIEDGRDLVGRNRPAIDETVDHLRDATATADSVLETVKSETIIKVNGFVDGAQQTIDGALATLERVRDDYERWSADLGETFGSAMLASQQLKLATIEVRRNPWKLLYRPTDGEIEHEQLYEAARSFALATADLKAASGTVERILDRHGEELRADPALFERITRNFGESIRNYERAQQQLFEVLVEPNQ